MYHVGEDRNVVGFVEQPGRPCKFLESFVLDKCVGYFCDWSVGINMKTKTMTTWALPTLRTQDVELKTAFLLNFKVQYSKHIIPYVEY